jgi:predicted RNase H-like HicB family nuclease
MEIGSPIEMGRKSIGGPMPRVLHCYAFGDDNEWQAICLDLDLAVQGRSFEEVFHRLTEVICLHLEGVMELPEEDQKRLLNRSVPWFVRVKFAVAAFIMALRTRGQKGRFEHHYTMPAPA